MVQNLLIRRGRTPGGLPPPRLLEHDRCLTDGSSGKLPLKVQRVKSQSWSCSAGCGIRQNLHDFSKIPTLCMLSIRWWYPWGCIPVHTCTYYYYTTYIYIILKKIQIHVKPYLYMFHFGTRPKKLCRPRFLSWPETTGGTQRSLWGRSGVRDMTKHWDSCSTQAQNR